MTGPDDDWNDPASLTDGGDDATENSTPPGVGMTMFVLTLFAVYGVYIGDFSFAAFAIGSLAIVAVAVTLTAAWITAMREFR